MSEGIKEIRDLIKRLKGLHPNSTDFGADVVYILTCITNVLEDLEK